MPGERLPSPHLSEPSDVELPEIDHNDSFRDVIKKVSSYVLPLLFLSVSLFFTLFFPFLTSACLPCRCVSLTVEMNLVISLE